MPNKQKTKQKKKLVNFFIKNLFKNKKRFIFFFNSGSKVTVTMEVLEYAVYVIHWGVCLGFVIVLTSLVQALVSDGGMVNVEKSI